MSADASQRVDAYIAQAPEYARPILEKIRKAFHKGCPQVEEVIKWGVPHFQYKGMLGGMAAFKNHVSFGFWKSKLMPDPENLFARGPKASMCNCQISSTKELPSQATLVSYVKEAKRLNEDDIKVPKTRSAKPPLTVPQDLKKILNLAKNRRAKAAFEGFSDSHRREYVEWITEAKTDTTRQKRLATTLEWLAEGKGRNWKYTKRK